ncbi:hypothetical protein DFR50_13059 [Roseiarcus fermentans]|uniref:Uncharacterized protein n=1 Tax=Roseiarcus fermentans TaxID=1473586 RepID=A0A366EVT8_9HYPH|nr:hypothetical protein [Roseiarcus fermentans]RBP06502.1 hypothetical protein DFR50_13059 [Roseiarcus fermentans]
MTDINRTFPPAAEPAVTPLRRPLPTTSGALFDGRDLWAFVAIAVMNLGPLAMGAFAVH